jgi:hypothetical protein
MDERRDTLLAARSATPKVSAWPGSTWPPVGSWCRSWPARRPSRPSSPASAGRTAATRGCRRTTGRVLPDHAPALALRDSTRRDPTAQRPVRHARPVRLRLQDCRWRVAAAGALLQYVRDPARRAAAHHRLQVVRRDDEAIIDAATRRNLELIEAASGTARHSLAGLLDTTATAMGSRELQRWISRPLRDQVR